MKPKIVVIGAGIAGLSIARDLSLRGFNVIILEKNTIGSGTTTKCAGMLHSGARYAVKNPKLARLCLKENKILKKIASFAIGKNKAIFVTLPSDDSKYHKEFERNCSDIGIQIKKLSVKEAKNLEPNLNSKITGGYLTPDAVIDIFKLIQAYTHDLTERGVKILESTNVLKADFSSERWILTIADKISKEQLRGDFVINTTGSDLAEVARLFGVNLELVYIHGTMAILNERVSSRIVTRCAPSAVGDVIIPLVNSSLIGSTWHELGQNNPISMSKTDEKKLMQTAFSILGNSSSYRIISSFTGIRTHIKTNNRKDDGNFNIKRDYAIIDHTKENELSHFISVLPGKLTTGRFVAEKVGNIVCEFFDLDIKSPTSYTPLKALSHFSKSELEFYVN